MRKIIIAFFISWIGLASSYAQTGWTWTELSSMPKRISNNAVVEGFVGNDAFVYSFSGIDSTKTEQGINLGSFKYDVQNDSWETIFSLPDTLGKIAAGASYVNGKIYILGGYHVLASGGEISSNKVHIYDPVSDTYLTDGAPIPVPIDDHVQAVWRDSLIFVVTGWSNTGNKKDVQIYDTYNNSWQVGTDLPYNNDFLAFGASGTIIGDTIIYNGGVKGGTVWASVPKTRIGIIDVNDPTQINWSLADDNPGAAGYRMACSNYHNRAFWIGGGGIAYNYDGLAYSNGTGVEPLERILQFKNDNYLFDEGLGTPFGIMDLRGVAKISDTEWISCGGMESCQAVTNKTFKI
jgi:N-acetylneuraminic acid mutarotase